MINAYNVALSSPFLMHEGPAITALHVARCQPAKQGHYYTKAPEFQSQAIHEFQPV
jgi:hypothetical protein